MSRTVNSMRNAATSIGGQLSNNVLRFISRTVFVYTLGKEYLGISSLYTNILTILSVSELGFSTVITYSLYRPLAEGDETTTAALMQFYKKVYRLIGMAILAIGLCLIPVLPRLMNGVTDQVNIYLYYILYLIQTVVSYLFFAYKGTLLAADQRQYISDLITYAVQVAVNLVQIAVLLALRSFLIYTLLYIAGSIVQNSLIALAADRHYPYIKKPAPRLTKEQTRSVFSKVYAMALYHICVVIGTATDNLVISSCLSVLMVGLYDNYNLIIQVVQKLISGFFRAFSSSLGNSFVTEEREKNLFIFRCLRVLNVWVVVVCSVCFAVLFQPFIQLWIGRNYLLDYATVLVIVGNFATNFLQSTVQISKESSGLFVRGKYRPVATAVLNLVISIVLVQRIGVMGVFLGSIISRLVTTWWYDAWLLYRHAFGISPGGYYVEYMLALALIYGLAALIQWLCRTVPAGWGGLLLRGAVCMLLTNGALVLIYCRSKELRYLIQKEKKLLTDRIMRKR